MGRNPRVVQEAFIQIEQAARNLGLQINESKTKYMVASSATTPATSTESISQARFSMGNYNFEVVDSFVYLGSTITANNNISTEVRARLLKANRAYFGLSRAFRSRNLSIQTKLLLYRTLILPVLTYSSETWVLTKQNCELLAAFERRILRRIFGPVCEGGRFRSLYNHEVYERYREVNVVKQIRLNRLRWAGHLVRKDEDDPAWKVFRGRLYATRRRGRPGLRWTDGVDQDASSIGVRNWRTVAHDRLQFRRLLSQAKTSNWL
ncbi:hypothetical protein DMENIID0001_145710 [Sergentomyia squamirostris]